MKKHIQYTVALASCLGISALFADSTNLNITTSDTPQNWENSSWTNGVPNSTSDVIINANAGVKGSDVTINSAAEVFSYSMTGDSVVNIASGFSLTQIADPLGLTMNSFNLANNAVLNVHGTLTTDAFNSNKYNAVLNNNAVLNIYSGGVLNMLKGSIEQNQASAFNSFGGTLTTSFYGSTNVNLTNGTTLTSNGNRELFYFWGGGIATIDNSTATTKTAAGTWAQRTMFMANQGATFTLKNKAQLNGADWDFSDPAKLKSDIATLNGSETHIGNGSDGKFLIEVLSGSTFSTTIFGLGGAHGSVGAKGTSTLKVKGDSADIVSKLVAQTLGIRGVTVANEEKPTTFSSQAYFEGYTDSVFNNVQIGSGNALASTAKLEISNSYNTMYIQNNIDLYASSLAGSTHEHSFIVGGSFNSITQIADLIVGSNNALSGNQYFDFGGSDNSFSLRALNIRNSTNVINTELPVYSNAVSSFNFTGIRNTLILSGTLNVGGENNMRSGTANFVLSGSNNTVTGTRFSIGAVTDEKSTSNMIISGNDNILSFKTADSNIWNSKVSADSDASFSVRGKNNQVNFGSKAIWIGTQGGLGSASLDVSGSGNLFLAKSIWIGGYASGSGSASFSIASNDAANMNTLSFNKIYVLGSSATDSTSVNKLIIGGNTEIKGSMETGDSRVLICIGNNTEANPTIVNSGTAIFEISGKNNKITVNGINIGRYMSGGVAKMSIIGSTHAIRENNWGLFVKGVAPVKGVDGAEDIVGTTAANPIGGVLEFVADRGGISTITVSAVKDFSGILELDFSKYAVEAGESLFKVIVSSSDWEQIANDLINDPDRIGMMKNKDGDDWFLSYQGNALWLTYISIPEPSTYAAMIGALALAFAIYRRRK